MSIKFHFLDFNYLTSTLLIPYTPTPYLSISPPVDNLRNLEYLCCYFHEIAALQSSGFSICRAVRYIDAVKKITPATLNS